ncbi:probable serine/threonine protein kinase IRE4 isoform X2 [Vitis vinifera]|uniref:probable serine/threonine protein kinase IRE4 isoform X2 n=1 Tax=Vitis vinifera TaxID=29760 RepID=UPI0008FECBEB|nr:probable serine/threonine protein kinase IRE4 isoform X2 [Vitis vinifera]|eukprot:XP_019072057.1 PREDICTED: probable serine/threonine protein kinase IRE4 isoform X2 [Vitis vinifera]
MAEPIRSGGDISTEIGIPTGLNRIKTRRESSKDQLNWKPDDDDKFHESRPRGISRPPANQKHNKGHAKFAGSIEGFHKGKKIARWFTSHLSKDSSQGFDDVPPKVQDSNSKVKAPDKEGSTRTKQWKEGKHLTGKQSSPEGLSSIKVPKGLKSFSHELGPKGGIPPSHPRAHSYNDLKELLGSLHSRFDAAKEVVNVELSSLTGDIMDALQRNDSSPGQKMAEGLLILAQQCMEMTPSEFRIKCETIVQGLTEKRQHCQTAFLKWLFTRMLFILTRCTRLLRFQKDSEPIDEKSLHNFTKCLESIPAVEMNWAPYSRIVDSGSDYDSNGKSDAKHELQWRNRVSSLLEQTWCRSEEPADKSGITSRKDSMVLVQKPLSQNSQIDFLPHIEQDGDYPGKSMNSFEDGSLHEPERGLDGSDSASFCSPENSRMQITNSAVISEGCSPKISEWRNKGVEGMFEDLHEMDTACIDDSYLTNPLNLKGHWGTKLSQYGAPSSTGSMTSMSSTNTPRAGHFDLFWLEHNNPSKLEDVQQMADLADIARCVAGTDLSKEGSCDFLLACMEDLQDVLQNTKLKSLVIDTFGGRIENLLREKYILACELADTKSPKSDNRIKESSRLLFDNASHSSTMSTPLHPLHKERTSIDDFEIIKPISRGAFGKVFLARKRTTGDLFAIKVLKKLDMIRKNDIERILAERNILITVRNPFVVRFFYSFTCRDNVYLVMEYLNGGDLYSLLRKLGCLEEDVARIYIAELVLALEYLHSLGIVHRDLKPDNILIAHDGHIKLTDFGLSKIGLINSTVDLSGPETDGSTDAFLDSLNLHTQQTDDRHRQSAVGTPDYLAPEILLGTEHGYAADWWSVGIILFELITGVPPFTAEHPEIIFDNILNRKIPWPSVPGDMSYEAQDLINRFLIHDPDLRLGANGLSEVKTHPFFKGVNWDTLALQKAVFVPQPDSADDTSYFVSRYSQIPSGLPDEQDCSDSATDSSDLYSNSGLEMDECGDLAEFDSSPLNLSLINFSFKNLSQLASINYDVLLQTGKDPTKCSPSKSRDT